MPRDRPFMLAFAARDPRKNTARTIAAFGSIAGRYPRIMLALIGDDRFSEDIGLLDAEVRSRAVTLGYVRRAELRALYCAALFLVYPSLYEGFGLPILEAMACGTAVLTSARGALPEVAGPM